MARPNLYLSHDEDYDCLACFEFGRTDDGHHPDAWHGVSEWFGWMLDKPDGKIVGFMVRDFSEFDPERCKGIWKRPRFQVPALGLRKATAGEICLAAKAQVRGDTVNRLMFGFATAHEGEEAMHAWRHVIEAGDLMGHFGLGYTLLELGDLHGAYKHLRAYTEIAKYSPWAWNYLGRAAETLGDHVEARPHYERAISLEDLQGEPTDADERLAGLCQESRRVDD